MNNLFTADTWSEADLVLRAVGLHKSYFRAVEVPVLRGVDLAIRRGEFTAIVGSSGSGKSTLLHLLGTLDVPSAGEVYYNGQRIDNRPARERDRFRNQVVGFVFQTYHLLPELNALENVLLPAMIRLNVRQYWSQKSRLVQHAKELLARVGLAHRITHKPRELSGGEMQRAAIARALLAKPQILLADEPTGNLDDETGQSVIELLAQLRQEIGLTVVMVTHDLALAQVSDRILRLTQGRLEQSNNRLEERAIVA